MKYVTLMLHCMTVRALCIGQNIINQHYGASKGIKYFPAVNAVVGERWRGNNPAVAQRWADPRITVLSATPQHSSRKIGFGVAGAFALRNVATGMFLLRCGFVRMIRNGLCLIHVGNRQVLQMLRQIISAVNSVSCFFRLWCF